MGRRIVFTPVETITFSSVYTNERDEQIVEDVDFTFNNYALLILMNEFGNIDKLQKEYETKPYDLAAIFLYCGVKPNRTDFTIEAAREIVAGGGPVVLEEVTKQVTNYFLMSSGEQGRELFLKEMESEGMLEIGKALLKKSR